VIRSAATMIALLWTAPVTTETVEIAGRGAIDLAPFACTDTPRSTIIRRICYDEASRRLLVNVNGGYAEHCGLPTAAFAAFASAPSMGQYYRQNIGPPLAGVFTCDAPVAN
jgi:hypothetical protein